MEAAPGKQGSVNILSVDVEDYFQVSAFENTVARQSWNRLECRARENTERILQLFEKHDTKATFFVLGWIAERYPELVKEIAGAGHEVASHGFGHARITQLTEQAFRRDITDSKALLEDLTGQPIIGYRAPSFSFSEATPWTFDALKECGYRYSSSINPVAHDLYGYNDAERTPFCWDNGLIEIPVATASLLSKRIPCAGGGYFRLYPYALSSWLLRTASRQLQGPIVFYFHPWEIDPNQPRVKGAPLKSRFRHYINLKRTLPRLERLLVDFDWGRMCDLELVRRAVKKS